MFRACYEVGLQDNPSLAGRVVVRFRIDSAGNVSSAYNAGSSLPGWVVIGCMVRVLYRLPFPRNNVRTLVVDLRPPPLSSIHVSSRP
jgi:hypothetical protein